MLEAFAELADGHQRHELPGCDADQDGQQHEQQVAQHVVKQVVAVVGPHRHLTLRVVQRMQGPPPVELVLGPVQPVIGKVEHHEVDQKAGQRAIGHARPELVQMEGRQAPRAQRADAFFQPVLEGEEHHQLEQAQAVDQRVDHVHTHRGPVGHGLHRPLALHRPDHRHHHRDLQQAHDEPAGAVVGLLQQVARTQDKGDRLHHRLVQPLLHRREAVGKPLHRPAPSRRAP